MTQFLAFEAVGFASVTKAVMAAVLLFGWARWATLVDKDALHFYIGRRLWNTIQCAAAGLAFAALFMIPMFLVGFILAVLILIGAVAAYVAVRNPKVGESDQWHLDFATLTSAFSQRREDRATEQATMRFAKPAPGYKQVPMPDDAMHAPHLEFEHVIAPAIGRRAERIDIAGGEGEFAVQVTIDGVAYRQSKLAAANAVAMIDYLKGQCGMDTADRRRKQVGQCVIELEASGRHNLRVATAGSTQGLTCTIQVDASKQVLRPLNKLGLMDSQLEAVKSIHDTGGIVLVATPSHQGRSTTLYALTGTHDPYTQDIHTLESATEAELEGVTQTVVDAQALPKTLNSLLLRDPAVVMIASLTEAETAKIAARAAAEENRRIYIGLKADNTMTALRMWIKAVGDPKMVGRGLTAVISQRLIRKLCPVCRVKYKPDAEALRKLNLPADRIKELYKSGGRVMIKNKEETCPTCGGLGYMDRIGAFEVMVLDDDAKRLVATGDLEQLRAHVRRNKTLWLQEAALGAVVHGETSISEVMRAMGGEK
ncbi:Flp pilus assembly complex ATPase component TadA [Planctomycetales bacterium ZRK34]|nr:Flp pilus assembly complex ATPase component TadA [Planctomycetales bacterium ZRK34]